MSQNVTLSALVVLKPQQPGAEDAPITSETVAAHLPSSEAIGAATAYFSRAGFEVSDVVGISFSVSGSPDLFERVFRQRVDFERASGGRVASAVTESGALEFNLAVLPREIARHVTAVTFTPPPDFGPTNP